jgi:hypothetical protein
LFVMHVNIKACFLLFVLIVRHKSTFSDFYENLCIKKFIQNFCPNVVLKLFNKCSLGIFSR